MQKLMQQWLGRVVLATAITAVTAVAGPVLAQSSADPKAPPAGYVAAPEPKPADTNAERGKSQPGNNAPMWRAVRESGTAPGISNLPGAEKGVLIQPMVQYPGVRLNNAGEAWRQVRNQWIIPYGGSLILIALLTLALFYWRKGPLGGHRADTGRVIERFTPFERATHWSNAIAFVTLAVSGLVMAFGKFLLLPVLGGTLFGVLSYGLKTAHNFAGPLFAVSLLLVLITFVKDNLPSKDDLAWMMRLGGMFSGQEVPSHRFNAGEKVVFWAGVLVLGALVVASGLVLDKLIPGMAYLRPDMQIAQMVHSAAAMVMLALFAGHIYMGTIGMKGAYQAMRTGYVDEAWAREHHELWHDDVKAGKIPAQRSSEPAPLAAPQA
ncbi:MAG: formate dehydrogenase subunit gamma [Betaproteobacteria bacterium]|nr:formate dehydrogenase subunit gamma [Betaproteobacteria bacterium]